MTAGLWLGCVTTKRGWPMFRMTLLIVAICGLATLPAHAAHQDTSPSSQASREVLVLKYLDAIEFDKTMDAMTATMIQIQTASYPERSGASSEILTAIGDVTTEVMRELRPAMMERYVALYAEVLTTDELSALVRFYESPTGRSITSKTPLLTQRSGPIVEELMPQMQQMMSQRLCSRVKCPEGFAERFR